MRACAARLLVSATLLLPGACGDDDDPQIDAASASVPETDAAVDVAPDVAPAIDTRLAPTGTPTTVVQPTTFKVRLENVAPFSLLKSGLYSTPIGGKEPGPLAPGQAYEFTFSAGKGQKLAFVSMFGQSNDWVFATAPTGIPLYQGDAPVSGDVTSQIALYDVGTESDEEPAIGAHTGPNQYMSIDGPGAVDPNRVVRKLSTAAPLTGGGTFALPAIAAMVKVGVTSNAATRQFTVRIENVANDLVTLMTSQGPKPVRISPGVWAVVTTGDAFFTEGLPDRDQGLEDLAESGITTRLATSAFAASGVSTPLSPGVFVVHNSGSPLFTAGQPDRGAGLERLAEDGNLLALSSSLATGPVGAKTVGVFAVPATKTATGPILSGGAYEFLITALPGDRLSLVTMFGWANDWIFGTADTGMALFDADNLPITGNVTAQLHLYDVGTEVSEEPCVGPNTGAQQPAANTGAVDTDVRVRDVPSATYPTPVSKHVKLVVAPQ